jgi:hypothetical protein
VACPQVDMSQTAQYSDRWVLTIGLLHGELDFCHHFHLTWLKVK